MGIQDTYSKRLKRQQQAGQSSDLQYDDLPDQFRVQVIHILRDAIGEWESGWSFDASPYPVHHWEDIHSALSREQGVLSLSSLDGTRCEQCQDFIQHADTLAVLDMIELAFQVIDGPLRREFQFTPDHFRLNHKQMPDDAINELNRRFMEHNLGYAFASGQIIRKDSEFIHAAAVQPAIKLLADAQFSGPSEEFMSAHEHYRHGRCKEAIQDALKSFESTMKAICDARQSAYKPSDTAKQLIKVLFDNELIPSSLQTHFNAFATVLESGLPTVRNKMAGHGQGATPVDVPPYFAAYALHLAAANIVMLVEAHKANCSS